jgi:hypothetical protein
MARIVNSTWSMIFAIVATFLVALVTADDTTTSKFSQSRQFGFFRSHMPHMMITDRPPLLSSHTQPTLIFLLKNGQSPSPTAPPTASSPPSLVPTLMVPLALATSTINLSPPLTLLTRTASSFHTRPSSQISPTSLLPSPSVLASPATPPPTDHGERPTPTSMRTLPRTAASRSRPTSTSPSSLVTMVALEANSLGFLARLLPLLFIILKQLRCVKMACIVPMEEGQLPMRSSPSIADPTGLWRWLVV